MARLLTQVEPETRVKVTKIEGADESDLKATLQDLGIAQGVDLTSLASGPINATERRTEKRQERISRH